MELKDGKLICTEAEYKLVKKWNAMASPYIAGLYLYSELRRNNKELVWDQYYYKDIYLAYRKKNVEIVEDK